MCGQKSGLNLSDEYLSILKVTAKVLCGPQALSKREYLIQSYILEKKNISSELLEQDLPTHPVAWFIVSLITNILKKQR